ncbi:MAG: hypothetical protein MUD11_01695 [Rhodobacteraceae bacterium]|nr:hypothetical protein [Paracoccaceae bacterium]
MADDSQMIRFVVKRGPLAASWIGPLCFVGIAVYVAYLITQFDGDLGPNPTMLFRAGFYGFISLGIIVPLFMAYSLKRRLPADVASGTLTVDAGGLLFDMGTGPTRIAWSRIAAVHPVSHRAGKPPGALFLPSHVRGPLPQPQAEAALRKFGGRWATVMPHPDGVILPIVLFGLDEAANIEAAFKARVISQR